MRNFLTYNINFGLFWYENPLNLEPYIYQPITQFENNAFLIDKFPAHALSFNWLGDMRLLQPFEPPLVHCACMILTCFLHELQLMSSNLRNQTCKIMGAFSWINTNLILRKDISSTRKHLFFILVPYLNTK